MRVGLKREGQTLAESKGLPLSLFFRKTFSNNRSTGKIGYK
jgi:hypothetical protein